jgi:hypothetical protein
MKVNLGDNVEFELFQREEIHSVEQLSRETKSSIYSWKTTGSSNWLEKGLSIIDVLGLVLLPSDSPDWIELPDDRAE